MNSLQKASAGVGLGALIGAASFVIYCERSVHAEANESTRKLPGDSLISAPVASLTHAVTVHGLPEDVWPWLVQMGSGRGGWYSYDFVDNGSRPSAYRILPEFQNIEIGTIFPALPGANDVFVVAEFERPRYLVLAWKSKTGEYFTTWAFALESPALGETRLIVRGRVSNHYRPYGLPLWFTKVTAPYAHVVMEHKQLLNIAHRVELLRAMR